MFKLLGVSSRSLAVALFLLPSLFICMFQVRWPSCIQCQICYMMFSDQSAISAHYDTAHAQSNTKTLAPRPEHPNARHKCDVCGRKFTKISNLGVHIRTVHSVDGPSHQCEVCGRKFTQKISLRKHLETVHSADGPRYKCEVCGKKFTQKGSLSLHLETVHCADGTRHECEICGRKFTQKSGLTYHRRTVHGVDVVHFSVWRLFQDLQVQACASVSAEGFYGFGDVKRGIRFEVFERSKKICSITCRTCKGSWRWGRRAWMSSLRRHQVMLGYRKDNVSWVSKWVTIATGSLRVLTSVVELVGQLVIFSYWCWWCQNN